VQEALDLALKKKAETKEWERFRVFEANAQEVDRCQLSSEDCAHVIVGPHRQPLVRVKKRRILRFLKE